MKKLSPEISYNDDVVVLYCSKRLGANLSLEVFSKAAGGPLWDSPVEVKQLSNRWKFTIPREGEYLERVQSWLEYEGSGGVMGSPSLKTAASKRARTLRQLLNETST